jgi:hypothetical protein
MAVESLSPYALWDDVGSLVLRSARLAGDSNAIWPVRGRAAALCYTLCRDVAANEALCAEFVRAAAACVETFPAVGELLAAAREAAPDESRLVAPLRRLCRCAHDGSHHATVAVTLVQLLEIPEFDGNIPQSWLFDARGLEHEAAYWLLRAVRRWVLRFGGTNEGVRAIIREQQDVLFLRKRLPLPEVLRLHAAEPTAAAWTALARRRAELMPGALPLSFGDRIDDATTALQEALRRQHDPGAHIALEGWLAELSP